MQEIATNRRVYLKTSKARCAYTCDICSRLIPRGYTYYWDDNPFARIKRGAPVRHLCLKCVDGTGAERVAASYTPAKGGHHQLTLPIGAEEIISATPVRLLNVTSILLDSLVKNYDEIYSVTPENFEYLIQDRLCAMGMLSERVGHTFKKDGGVDIVFWPARSFPVPFLGAVQVRHHRSPHTKTGPDAIRDMVGVLQTHPFQVGIIVTNTLFTPDAKWFARYGRAFLRLRDMYDLRRWIQSNFVDEAEWREMPDTLELCPGVTIDLRKKYFKD